MASLGAFGIRPIRAAWNGVMPERIRDYRASITFSLCAFMLVCSLLLGGGTRGGFLADSILELIAIPVLLLGVSSLTQRPIWQSRTRRDLNRVLAFCCVIVILPLVQLIPLPPWVWTHLPGREPVVKVFEVVSDQTPWMPLTVAPDATWLSFLSLLPPIATFVLATQLSYQERRTLSVVVMTVGVISVFLGLSQIAGGPASALRFFTITNPTEAVGFFANRNHFAAFLYAVLLFTAVWAIDIGFRIRSWREAASSHTAIILELTAIFVVFVAVIGAQAMARSRAGLLLTMVALLAIFALAFRDSRNLAAAKTNSSRVKVNKILLAVTVIAILSPVQFTLYRIMDRFADDPLADARIVFARNTITAAKEFMPFGSGLGSFVLAYQLFEPPNDMIANVYANRAHNDLLEIWLETGVIGPVLLCLFLVWLGFTSVKLWRRRKVDVSPFDLTLARAAAVVIALLLAHSLVDYPMRTEAIMAVFAMCCALIIEPLNEPLNEPSDGAKFAASLEHYLVRRETQPKAKPRPAVATVSSASTAAPAKELQNPSQPTRWGAGINWPEEWRYSKDQKEVGQAAPKSDTNS
jgi:O-antigen ligase